MKPWLILYLFAVNITAFALFGADKRKARRNAWRISERALFLSAVLGGSLGALIGMRLFHHKTKHWYFVIGIPAILVLQVIGCVLITNYF
jgi:uncharacterized membrane protein YsdA (DUF1294 family)